MKTLTSLLLLILSLFSTVHVAEAKESTHSYLRRQAVGVVGQGRWEQLERDFGCRIVAGRLSSGTAETFVSPGRCEIVVKTSKARLKRTAAYIIPHELGHLLDFLPLDLTQAGASARFATDYGYDAGTAAECVADAYSKLHGRPTKSDFKTSVRFHNRSLGYSMTLNCITQAQPYAATIA